MSKKINESPTIADTIQFDIETFDAKGCLAQPYEVTTATIYFIERDFSSNNSSNYDSDVFDDKLVADLKAAKQALCDNPSQENVLKVQELENQVRQTTKTQVVYYKQAVPVKTFGYEDITGKTESFPAWLNPDSVPPDMRESVIENNILTQAKDENNKDAIGKFNLLWSPVGAREGDYFICWTWKPKAAGDSISNFTLFLLNGCTQLTATLPTHQTNPEKYDTLMDRYLPSMFKERICDGDLSPAVLCELNKSVAKGFTFLENQANQILDVIDANVASESLLIYLANFFNVKLRTNDPTLWRRQIKQAIKLYKTKGTVKCLGETLAESGVTLQKVTRLWQVISSYTWQEMFLVEEGQSVFNLERYALPMDVDNCEVYYRPIRGEWIELTQDYVEFETTGGKSIARWVGDQLSQNPVMLRGGDSVRIIYKVADVETEHDQFIENYVRDLSLADQRDERDQKYPLKNWNVRVIEEDDPMLPLVIPNRMPLHDPLIFGKIRTEFPYSENVYNMEEYNGSTRESENPCDIDRNFIDSCKDAPGSKYNIDVEIEELSNDKIIEVQEIASECVPFHAVLHSINFIGAINEFVKPPVEEITCLVHVEGEELALAGEGQYIFNRVVQGDYAAAFLKRNMLADMENVVSSGSGSAYNNCISIYSPGFFESNGVVQGNKVIFSKLGVNIESVSGDPLNNSNLLEIYGPHLLAGNYSVGSTYETFANISAFGSAPVEPVNQSQFTFRLSNEVMTANPVDIKQDNLYLFYDPSFLLQEIQTEWDKSHINNHLNPWELTLPTGVYIVENILPNSVLILRNDGTLPTTNVDNIVWTLLDGHGNIRNTGTHGSLSVTMRGSITFNSATAESIQNVLSIGYYVLYNGTQYRISGFDDSDLLKLFIEDYSGGDAGHASVTIYQRLVDNAIGQFGYQGLSLQTVDNLEIDLQIQNGANATYLPGGYPNYGGLNASENNCFKENYLILIGSDYYAISDINGTTISLSGPYQEWNTTGTPVVFDVYKFIKNTINIPPNKQSTMYVPMLGENGSTVTVGIEPISPKLDIPGHEFTNIDRGGSPIIEKTITTSSALNAHIMNLAKRNPNELVDILKQTESISYMIEYDDGNVAQGEL